LCTRGAESCISYLTPTSAQGVGAIAAGWRVESYLQGCGSPDFPPNATARWAWNKPTPTLD